MLPSAEKHLSPRIENPFLLISNLKVCDINSPLAKFQISNNNFRSNFITVIIFLLNLNPYFFIFEWARI